MKKLLFFNALILVASICAAYSLILLDSLVHGTLYRYDLKFSYDWANPYWMLLRVVLVSVGLVAVFTGLSSVYVFRRFVYSKPEGVQVRSEKRMVSAPLRDTEVEGETHRVGGLVKCSSCQRVFAQPLRMLDFHSDRPRIISICPFCNEVIQPILRDGEVEKEKKAAVKEKKTNQEVKVSEETVAAST